MTDGVGTVRCVVLSESFRQSIEELIRATGLSPVMLDASQVKGAGPCVAMVILAGGAEPEAIDLLGGMARGVPRLYVVGVEQDHRLAVGAMGKGASDYFALPGDMDLLHRTLERDAAAWRGNQEAERFAEEERRLVGFDAILGESPVLKAVIEQARRVGVHRDVSIMIGGETGTGKEILARAIHYHSPRSAAPFVEINCAAIPGNLIESELFGHEKGAFTGAVASRPGLFELAQGGTVFLDEVGHLPVEAQPKLLRVLETRQVRRVGGLATIPIDVRVLAATHVDLRAAVAAGSFREDLYYRLYVVELVLPALRDRGSDIELLAAEFAARLAGAYGLPVPELTPAARAVLRGHRWPGNVRELRNAIERGLVLSPPGTLDIPDPARDSLGGVGPGGGRLPLFAPLATVIRSSVEAMMTETGGNKSEAARRLGISRPRLQRILDGIVE